VGATVAMAAASLMGPWLADTAGASTQVKEDCLSGYACGRKDADFANYEWGRSAIGDYNLAGTSADNNISSVFNHSGSLYAIYFDYAGSSNHLCVPPGYQNQNLAGTNMQDDISYIQITGYTAC
jgi:hypothetical protein